jgi:hypothetical protein
MAIAPFCRLTFIRLTAYRIASFDKAANCDHKRPVGGLNRVP